MPSYTFACKECGTSKTEVTQMKNVGNLHPACLECGVEMQRDYKADMFATPNDSYRTPLHSDSLAVAPSQRKEHEQKFPDVKLDRKCRPVFENFKQHEKYLLATGFQKNPGKAKRRSTRVSSK